MDEIISKVPLVERLAGLAEEAAELAQAALKYRRALDKTNPTPVEEDEAYGKLLEEIADVRLYLSTLMINEQYVRRTMEDKKRRWKDRIR